MENVRVEEPTTDHPAVEFHITYEAPALTEGRFCVGFLDEGGRDIGVSASPMVPLAGGRGTVRCTIQPLPLQSGIYFPVVAILSPDGLVQDRWRLDRALVVDRDGDLELAETFGPVQITASWSTR